MKDVYYPLASSTWSQNEYDSIERVIRAGKFTMGNEVALYEQEFAKFFGSRFAVMSNSGSSANLLALAGLKYMKDSTFENNDEIIVPAVSWSTTFYPIHQLGYTLKFVDVDSETLNIDIDKVKESVSKRTKAVLAVNLLGNPCNLTELQDICEEKDLTLIEDNCESMGALLHGRSAGTFGMAGTFSSFFSHHISTMEGGMTLTDNKNLYEAMVSLRAHGWTRELSQENSVHNKTGVAWDDLYRFVLPGYNLRPLELEAAIGREQIKKLSDFVAVRRLNAEYLKSNAWRFPNIRLQKEFGQSSWFGFSLLLSNNLRRKRSLLVDLLSENGIESRPIVAGNFTKNPVIRHLRHVPLGELPEADDIHFNGLFVGNHHYDLRSEIERLVELLEKFEEKHA